MKIGFTIGKFAPLHKGHEYMFNIALKEMDIFYVVIYETDKINIDIKKRAQWIQKLYPNIKILYAHNPPSQYGLDKKSVNIQMKYLSNIIKNIPVTHFYSSEPYGKHVSKYLNIINREVNIKKDIIPISATIIRNNIEENKNYLSKSVYESIVNNNKTM